MGCLHYIITPKPLKISSKPAHENPYFPRNVEVVVVSGPQQSDLPGDGAAPSHHLQTRRPGQPVREPYREGRQQDQGDP